MSKQSGEGSGGGGGKGKKKTSTARLTSKKPRSKKCNRHQQVIQPMSVTPFITKGPKKEQRHANMNDFVVHEHGDATLKATGEKFSKEEFEAIRRDRSETQNSLASAQRPNVQLHRGRKASTAA